MDYNAPSGSSDPNAGFVGATASTQGSKIPPKAAEYPQREIVHAIKGAGLTQTNNDLTQLLQTVSTGAIPLGTFGGTADALTATMPASALGVDPVIIPALRTGMRLKGFVAYANATTTPKLTLTGVGAAGATVVLPILRRDGSALAVGDLKTGRSIEVEIDSGGNARLVGTVSSDFLSYTPVGGLPANAFTPNQVASDTAFAPGFTTSQTVTITGARWIQAQGQNALSNASSTLATLSTRLRLMQGATIIGDSPYLGACNNNSLQDGLVVNGSWSGLDPTLTYTLMLISQKGINVGPVTILDARITSTYGT